MNDIGVNPGELRHGLSYLWPSEVAEQYYCEYKVHLKRLHPEVLIDLPPLEFGEASHAVLAGQAAPITPAEIDQSIRAGKKLALAEWTLEASFQGVRIRGRPDFFAFEGKKAALMLDFKFSGATRPFRDQEVQAELYALLAKCADFATEKLCFGIVLFPPARIGGGLHEAAPAKAEMLRLRNDDGTLHKIYERCKQVREALLIGRTKTKTVEGDGWTAFLYRFDGERAAKNLTWALGYWRGEREPIPVKRYPGKCFACPFNAAGLCQYALQAPDPGFKVQRMQDGRVFIFRG
jgi:hypothetical protein